MMLALKHGSWTSRGGSELAVLQSRALGEVHSQSPFAKRSHQLNSLLNITASLCSAKGAKEDTSHLALVRGRDRAQCMEIFGTFLCVMVVFR